MRFKDQTVVITGAGRGIGFATAERLSQEGAMIALIDVQEELVAGAASRLREKNVDAKAYPLNIADHAQVKATFERIAADFGAIHVLVNAAAIYPFIPFEDISIEDFRRVLAVNVEGTFSCCQAAYRFMKGQAYGRIVNFSSGSLYAGTPLLSAYCASKGGVVGLTRALASECSPHGITVNCVSPGIMATEGTLSQANADELLAWIETYQKVKRRGEPGDIAEIIAYLASPAASFVTGQTMAVDGGVHFRD